MTPSLSRNVSIIACMTLSLSLSACNKPPAAKPVVIAVATPAAKPPLSPPAPTPLTPALPAIAEASFNFNTVPDHPGRIAPFPYVDYPAKVGAAFQTSSALPMDEAYVILGKSLHAIDGRIAVRSFFNSDAGMSALESRRNYENAMQALGAVKVNTVAPEDAALVAANGDEYVMRTNKLRIPEQGMSYDVYLVRSGAAHHWVVLMVNDRMTRLMAIEEQAFVQTIGVAGATGAPLPPFPFFAWPPKLGAAFQVANQAEFDAAGIIVGKELRTVEGKVATLAFYNSDAGMSQMALRRNYEAIVKAMGGVKVNTVAPEDSALIAANGDEVAMREKKLRIPSRPMSYDSYLVHASGKNIWLVLMFSEDRTNLLAVEEKTMQQSVALVTADTMRTELAAHGHIPLYINFDTDQATIRSDGKPLIDQIAALLSKDTALNVSIEGHTDNSGDNKHNLELSRQRADAVVHALVASGIDNRRLKAAGRGAGVPLADNKDEAGRAKNRRVELVKL